MEMSHKDQALRLAAKTLLVIHHGAKNQGARELASLAKQVADACCLALPMKHRFSRAELEEFSSGSIADGSPEWFEWVVKFGVHRDWVEDGFNLDDECALSMLEHVLAFAHTTELKAEIISAPDSEALRETRGEPR